MKQFFRILTAIFLTLLVASCAFAFDPTRVTDLEVQDELVVSNDAVVSGNLRAFGPFMLKDALDYTPATTTATALSIQPTVYTFTTSGAGTSTTGAYTLATTNVADGTVKILLAKSLVSTKNVVITPAELYQGSTITFGETGDSATLVKYGSKYVIVGSYGL